MPKEYYTVSYKFYFNDRLKPTIYQGREVYPLYARITYDRETTFFKSYYFDVFSQPKYDFLKITIPQMEALESRTIDFIINFNTNRFSLHQFSSQYKIVGVDMLDSFDKPFKRWLASFLNEKGLPGLAAMTEQSLDEVPAIRIWDDFKKILDPALFDDMQEKAFRVGPPYILFASFIRHKKPEGPFCLPLFEWLQEEKRIEIENYFDSLYRWTGEDHFARIIKEVEQLLYPEGIL